jgi:hypothetical protein
MAPSREQSRFYRSVIDTLRDARVPFLVGGAFALTRHSVVRRATKDLDIFIRREDWPAVARALRDRHIYARLLFPHWLGKALNGRHTVDMIFASGNGQLPVTDAWFSRAVPARVLGRDVGLCAPEDMIVSKAFVMERERFDGADVMHLLLAQARTLDWNALCHNFHGHERVLLAYLVLFEYVYPHDAHLIPRRVIRRLLAARNAPLLPAPKLCRGTLISREQYLVDIRELGYADARLPPFGRMSPRERAIWTRAIRTPKS